MLPTQIGRYTVESLIGRGGMGVVYLARDPNIERQVAIKLLHDPYLTEPKFKERFQREARIVARLDHPAIVPVYDFGKITAGRISSCATCRADRCEIGFSGTDCRSMW